MEGGGIITFTSLRLVLPQEKIVPELCENKQWRIVVTG
jgi:hypothetical protein